ncbi:hypothetical protein DFJ73DRAFT_840742 [Zopfochytrium polystomum]|nr:hypothetical protein DFJ73DRAFT_840742 [Zopfochytrium polystomum]
MGGGRGRRGRWGAGAERYFFARSRALRSLVLSLLRFFAVLLSLLFILIFYIILFLLVIPWTQPGSTASPQPSFILRSASFPVLFAAVTPFHPPRQCL